MTTTRDLTESQAQRLQKANIVASCTAGPRYFHWWPNAHTGNSYRGEWRFSHGYNYGNQIIDADTIDELFDKGLSEFEGKRASDFLLDFEEKNYKICLLKAYLERTIKNYKASIDKFFVEKRFEGYITTASDKITVRFHYQSTTGVFSVYNLREHYRNQCMSYYEDMAEISSILKDIMNKIKELKLPFDHRNG